jgi:hypothetical protein
MMGGLMGLVLAGGVAANSTFAQAGNSQTVMLSIFSEAGKLADAPFVAAEPATGLLLGVGLAMASLMGRRKKKPTDNTVWESLG